MSRHDYLSTGEAAQLLNVSRSSVSRRFDLGILQGKLNPLTGERLISRDSLLAFMKQHDLPINATIQSGKKLLLGCADSALRTTLRTLISLDNRLQLAESEQGADTLIACSMEPPDLLILGDDLPDIACGEVVQSLRRRQAQARLKILCCLHGLPAAESLQWGADMVLPPQDWQTPEALKPHLLRILELSQDTSREVAFEHQRRWPRYQINLPARAGIYRLNAPRQHSWGTAVVRNISEGGAFLSPLVLEGSALPNEPFRLVLEIDHPPLSQWQAYCQVSRLQSNGELSAGIQFVRVSQEDLQKVATLATVASTT